MHSIAEFINPAPATVPSTSVAHAQSLLIQAPDRHIIAIADDGRPCGLVTREAALAADPAGCLGDIMDPEPPILPADLSALEACRLIAQDLERSHDGFLICEDGLCVGAGSLRALLDGLYNTHEADPVAGAIAATVREEQAAAPFKRHFLDRMSEELRGPMEAVLAMTDRLERQPLAADAHSHVQAIKESGQTLRRILTAGVDLARAEQGLLTFQDAPVVLRDLIDAVQVAWVERAARFGVTLLISFDGDPDLTAITDGARLRQVFDSLIGAAMRKTHDGSIEVGLKARAEGDGVRIEGRVRDTGPGLEPERLARVFETDTATGGGGMGMALARQIVLGLNGCIRAESNAGAGLSMIFDLFCTRQPRMAEARQHAGAIGSAAAHILVVDDNATNRMVAEALCEMFDCTSETAVDGVEAVDIARSGRFDVILMDIKMPRMDGVAASRAIRALPGAAGVVPIIALTANVDPEDARTYLANGMCQIVEKPIKPEQLLNAINQALASSGPKHSAAA